jgi:hypothetical protein
MCEHALHKYRQLRVYCYAAGKTSNKYDRISVWFCGGIFPQVLQVV